MLGAKPDAVGAQGIRRLGAEPLGGQRQLKQRLQHLCQRAQSDGGERFKAWDQAFRWSAALSLVRMGDIHTHCA